MDAIMYFGALFVVALCFVYVTNRPNYTIADHWQHFMPGNQFSATEYYSNVTKALAAHGIKKVSVEKERFLESHLFSATREYLRLSKGEYIFFVCAAPFSNGMFVSWWLCIKYENVLHKIPIIRKLLGIDRNNKTFYQMDTEAMYKSAIHEVISTTVKEMAETNATRGMPEFDLLKKLN
jgi:hypothetical protein